MNLLTFSNLKKTLANFEFEKVNSVTDIRQYSVKGDVVTIWLPLNENPYLFSFFGEKVEEIKELQIRKKEKSTSFTTFNQAGNKSNNSNLLDYARENYSWTEYLIVLQNQIVKGDFVVHEDHGVAQYNGIVVRNQSDYLYLQYFGEDKLYIPTSQISRITKYIGASENPPKVTKLNGGEWLRITHKVKESVALIARDLLIKMAKRESSDAPHLNAPTDLYSDFCKDFKFNLTVDQEKVMEEIETDLFKTKPIYKNILKPMNRLLVADVGFGKTEMAMRASFIVTESNHQVVILCPTTILAVQHYKLFKDRFEKFGIKVGHISSFNSSSENHELIKKIAENKIDIIIGTHRVLQNDVKIPKLGLLVIDEEQKFGVKQKEKIKAARYGVHVLSMSATPIPRSLSLALSKLQEISIITTPPTGRKAIKTYAQKLNWNKIVEIISFEKSRNGQVYFVHNDIKTIYSIQNKLQQLLPNLKFAVGYSHTTFDKKNKKTSLLDNNTRNLKETIEDFYEKKFDVLITTTIIENGIDMPNVNTIIINKAQNLGLSQLHQLRGRVGRSELQGYCYIFFDEIIQNNSDKSQSLSEINKPYAKRIQTIVEESELGAGFNIASRDLQIRGSGNILGKEQSGNINLIGYGMYIKLLEEEIRSLV
jgi:transcription-repair coupling factor (superfamily II helicase)